jgi:hypothetical protein
VHRNYWLRSVLCGVFMALLVNQASAGKARPDARPLVGTDHGPVPTGAAGVSAICAIGITDEAVSSVGYIYPDEDQYYTLIDPAECAEGAACGVTASIAHVVLEFSYAMSTPVRVGIVQADLSDAACPVPVPGSYLCAPATYDLGAPDGGVFDLALPLSASCHLAGPAFLEITFTTWGPYWDVPSLVLTGSCDGCRSYNYYPGNDYDLCTFGFDGNPIMYVEAECANPVGTASSTWGGLKAQYR